MGVKFFFHWYRQNFGNNVNIINKNKNKREAYPKENKNVLLRIPEGLNTSIDNLMLDLNGMFHASTQKIYEYGTHKLPPSLLKRKFKKSGSGFKQQIKVFNDVCQNIEKILLLVKPKKRLILCVDGPAPMAKQVQQRQRRFKSAMEKDDDEFTKFDGNCISPGTKFMDGLNKYIEWYIRKSITENPTWRQIEIIFSSHAVPGEGEHKCLAIGTLILLYNGKIKKVEDIIIGDILIGDNGNPRTVLNLTSGVDEMFEIIQTNGDNYTVNKNHILSLQIVNHKKFYWDEKKGVWILEYFDKTYKKKHFYSYSYERVKEEKNNKHNVNMIITKKKAYNNMINFMKTISDNNILDISVSEYLKLPNNTQKKLYGYRSDGINWDYQKVYIDPYLIGLWIGMVSSLESNIDKDKDIIEFLYNHECSSDKFKNMLKKYNLIMIKHIPKEYIVNDKNTRLQVLAGIIDKLFSNGNGNVDGDGDGNGDVNGDVNVDGDNDGDVDEDINEDGDGDGDVDVDEDGNGNGDNDGNVDEDGNGNEMLNELYIYIQISQCKQGHKHNKIHTLLDDIVFLSRSLGFCTNVRKETQRSKGAYPKESASVTRSVSEGGNEVVFDTRVPSDTLQRSVSAGLRPNEVVFDTRFSASEGKGQCYKITISGDINIIPFSYMKKFKSTLISGHDELKKNVAQRPPSDALKRVSKTTSFPSDALWAGQRPALRVTQRSKGAYPKESVSEGGKKTGNKQITSIQIQSVGINKYYGFNIDGNQRFLLGDFTVTHNCITYIRDYGDLDDKYCIYGMDADLIMLTLATHVDNFFILRDDMYKLDQYYFLNIGNTRKDLANMMDWTPKESKPYKPYNPEYAINDFIFMLFMVGNDFLPHIPCLEIIENGVDVMLTIHKNVCISYGHLTRKINGVVKFNKKSLEIFLGAVSQQNKGILEDKMSKKENFFPDLLLEKYTSVENGKCVINIKSYKEDYYKTNFEDKLTHDTQPDLNKIKKICLEYIEGLQWVLNYYTSGTPSWTWCYKHHYGPFASDLAKYMSDFEFIDYGVTKPTTPFQQLLCVLPPKSSKLIPEPLCNLLTDPKSKLKEFCPDVFKIDLSGKRKEWEGLVLLPMVDFQTVVNEYNKLIDKLNPVDLKRDVLEDSHLYMYNPDCMHVYNSSFGDIKKCPVELQIIEL
jgi:hypothetical protein